MTIRVLGLVLALAASRAGAQPGEPSDAEPAQGGTTVPQPTSSAPPPETELTLDRLLRVPLATDYRVELKGGRDRTGWEAEFEQVRGEIARLEGDIERNQQRLRARSGEDWSFAPPGAAGPATDPEVMKLRANLRRDRESLAAARVRLQDLEVEASLAGVPDEWIRPAAPVESGAEESVSAPGR